MDAVFFLLLLFNFGIGAFCLIFLLAATMEPPDPGASSLALPFFPLLTITLLQIVDYYLQQRFPERPFVTIDILYDIALVMIAFSWNYIAYTHYHLNGADRRRPGAIRLVGVTAALLAIGLVIGHLRIKQVVPILHSAAIAMLFFAGIKGVRITGHTERIYPSSRTAQLIALISLIVYPLIAVGDAFGWRLPFLDRSVTFWAQAHPLYVTTVTIPLFLYTYQNRIWSVHHTVAPGEARSAQFPSPSSDDQPDVEAPISATIPSSHVSMAALVIERPASVANEEAPLASAMEQIGRRLTPREREILVLLYEGHRYREIAQKLFVSLTTVRTHIHHIYEKLDISRKEELFIVIRETTEEIVNRNAGGNAPQI
jgi:DNA-binding CsgD family transcriptional regulator